jgi:hypothetical protein
VIGVEWAAWSPLVLLALAIGLVRALALALAGTSDPITPPSKLPAAAQQRRSATATNDQ